MDDLFKKNGKEETYYEILNCVPTSNQEQITAEYRVLAKQYHPDKNKDVDDDKGRKITMDLVENINPSILYNAHFPSNINIRARINNRENKTIKHYLLDFFFRSV